MAQLIHGFTGRDVYHEVLSAIRLFGRTRPSRNGMTRDLGHTTICLERLDWALPIGTGRKLSKRIAAAEALQLIGGFSDPEWLVKLAPQFERYMESERYFFGAYGPRLDWQTTQMLKKLQDDPWTRQAIGTIWKPSLDNIPGKKDYPCTVSIGIAVNPRLDYDALDMFVTMRSNDAWLGLPYDMFQFTQYQLTLAMLTARQPGTYTHTAYSMHLYDEHISESHDVGEFTPTDEHYPLGIGEIGCSHDEIKHRAWFIAMRPGDIDWDYTPSEEWYLHAIHG